MEPVEEIKKLLDDYYGEHRDEDTKEDIANLVVNYFEDIKKIVGE